MWFWNYLVGLKSDIILKWITNSQIFIKYNNIIKQEKLKTVPTSSFSLYVYPETTCVTKARCNFIKFDTSRTRNIEKGPVISTRSSLRPTTFLNPQWGISGASRDLGFANFTPNTRMRALRKCFAIKLSEKNSHGSVDTFLMAWRINVLNLFYFLPSGFEDLELLFCSTLF